MTFQPVVPFTGLSGWLFLERTAPAQKEAFNQSASVQRTTDYFREKIGEITTAKELVDDRRLLSVALGAFGLDDDIDNKFFIQKILEDGTLDPDALAVRLSDSRYKEFSAAFGFGDFGNTPRTQLSGFPDEIIDRYQAKQFELAVGEQNQDLRLALNVESSLGELISSTSSEDAQWFSIMGNPPLRRVFEYALGLPSSIARIDLDQQLVEFREKAVKVFGTDKLTKIADNPEAEEKLIRLFLIRSEAEAAASIGGASIALNLLQAIPPLPKAF